MHHGEIPLLKVYTSRADPLVLFSMLSFLVDFLQHQALRAAVEGLHKYKLLVVESLQDKTMMRKHVRAVHELRQDNRALRAVENAAVTKCTELSEYV